MLLQQTFWLITLPVYFHEHSVFSGAGVLDVIFNISSLNRVCIHHQPEPIRVYVPQYVKYI